MRNIAALRSSTFQFVFIIRTLSDFEARAEVLASIYELHPIGLAPLTLAAHVHYFQSSEQRALVVVPWLQNTTCPSASRKDSKGWDLRSPTFISSALSQPESYSTYELSRAIRDSLSKNSALKTVRNKAVDLFPGAGKNGISHYQKARLERRR